MKKIGIFTGFFLPHLGGVERYTSKLTEELSKQGCKIYIITSNHDDQEKQKGINYNIYRFTTHKLFKQRYPLIKKDDEYFNIFEKLDKEKLDFIICNTRFYMTTLLGLNYAKKNNIPSLVIEHGSNHFSVNNRIYDFFGKIFEHIITSIIKRKTNYFYGVSGRCNNWLKHFNVKASGIIYNSIDGNDYEKYKLINFKHKKYDKEKIIITFASRLIKEKGIFLILDSFVELQKKHPNLLLFIAGEGPLLSQLKQDYNLENIIFLGKLSYDEIMSLFNITSIFVHPSMYPEGLPTSILEAGLMECAVVATDRGGTIEVIKDDSYGLICEENIGSLTKKLEILISNRKKREVLAKNLHNRIIENFTWEVTAKKLIDEMEKIKNEKR